MGEDRRKAARARISHIHVTYESAAGDQVEAFARDIGRGGLFIQVATPLAVGKRIALEIQVQGEPASWSALGRVLWTRNNADGAERPPGMGVKLIDVDDAVLTTIEELVARETPLKAPPGREKTIIGIGSPELDPAPFADANQTTVETPLVTQASDDRREASVVIDLVPKSEPPASYDDLYPPHPSDAPAAVARRRRGRWFVVVLLLLIAAAAVYALLLGDFDRVLRSSEPPPVPGQPPAPVETAPPVIVAPAPTREPIPAPTPVQVSPGPAVSASPSARAPAGSVTTGSAEPKRAPAVAPPHPTWRVGPPPTPPSGARKPGTEDNPY